MDILCFAACCPNLRDIIRHEPIIYDTEKVSDTDLALGPRWQGIKSERWPVLREVLEGQRLTIDRINNFVQHFYTEYWQTLDIPYLLFMLSDARGTGSHGVISMLAMLYEHQTLTELHGFMLSHISFLIRFYFGENALKLSAELLLRLKRRVISSWKNFPRAISLQLNAGDFYLGGNARSVASSHERHTCRLYCNS